MALEPDDVDVPPLPVGFYIFIILDSDVGLFHRHMSFLSCLFIDGAQRKSAAVTNAVDGFSTFSLLRLRSPKKYGVVSLLWVTAMRLLFAQRSKQTWQFFMLWCYNSNNAYHNVSKREEL
jgi:hypothetical protein